MEVCTVARKGRSEAKVTFVLEIIPQFNPFSEELTINNRRRDMSCFISELPEKMSAWYQDPNTFYGLSYNKRIAELLLANTDPNENWKIVTITI